MGGMNGRGGGWPGCPADDGRRGWVALFHPLGELDVRRFVVVRLGVLRQPLRDDEQRQVHAIHEQVGDAVLDVFHGTRDVAADENLLQHRLDHLPHEQAVIAAHGFDTLWCTVLPLHFFFFFISLDFSCGFRNTGVLTHEYKIHVINTRD